MKHDKRHNNWLNLAPLQTRELSKCIRATLLPELEAMGFKRVEVRFGDQDQSVGGAEIRLERLSDNCIDCVIINFDKYRRPSFQMMLHKRQEAAPHEWVRSAWLVARSRPFTNFLGKPWWQPNLFWSEIRSSRLTRRLVMQAPQIEQFLDSGETGPNIREGL